MKEIPRISEAEWDVVSVLWKKSPLTANQVLERLPHREWKLNTVRTFLARLTKKGVISSEAAPEGQGRIFRPAISREECVQEASQSFLDRVFEGTAGALCLHFARSKKLSPREVKELRAILDETPKRK